MLSRWKLLAIAPDELRPANERVIDAAAQRLPAKRRIRSIQVGHEIVLKLRLKHQARIVPGARVRSADVKVGGFADVCVGAQVPARTYVFTANAREHISGVAAEHLPGAIAEQTFGRGRG